jgi:hypothetical protein
MACTLRKDAIKAYNFGNQLHYTVTKEALDASMAVLLPTAHSQATG